MTTHTARKIVSLSMIAAAAAVFGCKNAADYPPIGANDPFRPDDEPRAVDGLFAQQGANAAREDGTLYACHFTDGKLNSLGYQKLSAMAFGPETGKLAVYLDVPKGEPFDACQDSVMKALDRGGYKSEQYTIKAGGNPSASAPAVQGLSSLGKLHGGSGDATASPDAGTLNPTAH